MEQQINRQIIISEEITEQTAERVISHISAINEYDAFMDESIKTVNGKYEPQPIELIISSGGGSAHAGFAIIGAMEMSATPVYTYGLGLVGSMALGIYVSGDRRVAHNLARFMYHSVAYGEMGKLQDHREALTEVEILQETYDLLFTRATKLTKEQMIDIQTSRVDFHFSAQESIVLGVSDDYYGRFEVECDPNNPCEDCDCELKDTLRYVDDDVDDVDDLVTAITSSTDETSKDIHDELENIRVVESEDVPSIIKQYEEVEKKQFLEVIKHLDEEKSETINVKVSKEMYEVLKNIDEDDIENWKEDLKVNGIDGLDGLNDYEEEEDEKLEYKVNEELGEQESFVNKIINKLKRNK